MSTPEQSFLLSDADRAVLSSKKNRALLMAPAMGAAAILCLLVLVGLLLAGVFSLLLITLLLLGFGFAAKALLSTISFVRLSRDLRENQKRFINAPVEAQDIVVPSGGGSAGSYVFWIKAGGRKINVSEDQYYKVKKGDLVQAYVAPHSGTVFGLSTNGVATEIGSQPLSTLAPPQKQMSKKTRRIVIASIAAAAVLIVFVAVAGVAVMSMSDKTYNSLNPFAPKPPKGAFPDSIGGYKQDGLYFKDHRSYGYGYEFTTYYKSGNDTVEYDVIDYGSADQVKQKLGSKSYFERDMQVVQQTDNRVGAITSKGWGVVLLAAGPRLVKLAGKASQLTEFEKQLPYAALGLSPPQAIESLRETPVPVTTLILDFAKDKLVAGQKYADKPLLYSGSVTSVTTGLSNTMLVGLQTPGTNRDSVTAIFPMSEATRVKELKPNQVITLRCRVFVFTDTKNFSTLDHCKLE